ncbi:MAG: hypothetical protein AYL31_009340 [Candidatus Bathyarchaeota archaeon B26-1]|nr:MAG: hypothetical protein AYL31_009340 [Candidatus Bathyarchaeota archaeon B26-1]
MACIVKLYEKPALRDPVLIEGLPGIGLVANIAASYMIRELQAKLFGEIKCSAFQNVAVTVKGGSLKFPTNRLYYHKGRYKDERDLIILFGNTQALTTRGQYELCGKILDVSQELGCKYIITMGGYRPGTEVKEPKLYYAASDLETAEAARSLGAEVLRGQIFGAAGLLVALGKLRGMKGFCILAETPGTYPDEEAAREVLKAISKILGLRMRLDGDVKLAEGLETMRPFDLQVKPVKPERESKPQWFI